MVLAVVSAELMHAVCQNAVPAFRRGAPEHQGGVGAVRLVPLEGVKSMNLLTFFRGGAALASFCGPLHSQAGRPAGRIGSASQRPAPRNRLEVRAGGGFPTPGAVVGCGRYPSLAGMSAGDGERLVGVDFGGAGASG
ncbi:hypothetical protein EIJ57_23865 [Xanthomonas perforans]|nr:hypothetical protein EIJ57_23865 [Xanthomonas perforans]